MKESTKSACYWRKHGKNFMTPSVMRYLETERYLVELSTGSGFDRKPIYGVSVATISGERDYDRSQMFHSESEASEYITGLDTDS